MEQQSKPRRNWWGLVIQVVQLIAAFFAGDAINPMF